MSGLISVTKGESKTYPEENRFKLGNVFLFYIYITKLFYIDKQNIISYNINVLNLV